LRMYRDFDSSHCEMLKNLGIIAEFINSYRLVSSKGCLGIAAEFS